MKSLRHLIQRVENPKAALVQIFFGEIASRLVRTVGRTQDISLRQTFPVRPHPQPDFCGDDYLVASAALLEPLANDGFRFPTAIARRESGISVSSVDQIESGGDESIEQPEGRSLIHRPPKDVPAERQ